MRLFYEAWQILDPNSSVTTDDNNSTSVLVELESDKSTGTLVDLQANEIDIYKFEVC